MCFPPRGDVSHPPPPPPKKIIYIFFRPSQNPVTRTMVHVAIDNSNAGESNSYE